MANKKKTATATTKKRKRKQHDDGTYRSRSTIDNPPKPEKEEPEETEAETEPTDEAQQQPLIPEATTVEEVKDYLDGNPVDREFGIELKCTLKPGGKGKAITFCFLAGEFDASRIPELLALAVVSRKNSKLIDSALDLPDDVAVRVRGDRMAIRKSVNDVYKRTPAQASFVEASQPKETEPIEIVPVNGHAEENVPDENDGEGDDDDLQEIILDETSIDQAVDSIL